MVRLTEKDESGMWQSKGIPWERLQAGETITVLKDCSVSGTLRVIREFRQDMAECARLCRRLLHHGERNGLSE